MATDKSRETREGRVEKPPAKNGNAEAGVQDALGRRLREVYQEVVNEEIPKDFLKLLAELKKRESGGDSQA